MIAQACIATQLPPEAFGVPSSPELGAVMIGLLREQSEKHRTEEMSRELASRHG